MTATAPLPSNVLSMDERRPARIGRWMVIAGFGGFMLWAALAPLDKGVPLSGNVVVAGSRQAVQHPTGGVIEQLLVRDGDQVTACLLYTSPSPRDLSTSRMPSSA